MGAEVVALAAGAAFSAFSSLKQGQAAKEASEYNANVAAQNAKLSLKQGAEEERRVRVMARKQIGETRASFGANNLSIEGSALDILQESIANAEHDALNIRYGAQARSSRFTESASMDRRIGNNAETAGYLSASGALLSGAANVSRRSTKADSEDLDLGGY